MAISLYQIISVLIILTFSLILSVQDIKQMAVRTFILWVGILAALVCQLIFSREMTWIYILSSLLMGIFYFAVRKITKGKLGMADVFFGFFQGLFLVPKMIPLCLGIECLAALCFMKKKTDRKTFPFIPFMSFGLILSLIIQFIIG